MGAGLSSLPASSSSDLNKDNVCPVAPNIGMRRMQQRHVQALSVDIPVHTFRKRRDGLMGHSLTLYTKGNVHGLANGNKEPIASLSFFCHG